MLNLCLHSNEYEPIFAYKRYTYNERMYVKLQLQVLHVAFV